MDYIEDFRAQLIKQNPIKKTKVEEIRDDIDRAFEALDVLTDHLYELMEDTSCKDCLLFFAQMRGEMCSAYNSILFAKEMMEEGNGDCSQTEQS